MKYTVTVARDMREPKPFPVQYSGHSTRRTGNAIIKHLTLKCFNCKHLWVDATVGGLNEPRNKWDLLQLDLLLIVLLRQWGEITATCEINRGENTRLNQICHIYIFTYWFDIARQLILRQIYIVCICNKGRCSIPPPTLLRSLIAVYCSLPFIYSPFSIIWIN